MADTKLFNPAKEFDQLKKVVRLENTMVNFIRPDNYTPDYRTKVHNLNEAIRAFEEVSTKQGAKNLSTGTQVRIPIF